MKLCQFIRIKGFSYYTLAHIFVWIPCNGFGLVWKEKLFEEDMMRGREEVFTYAAFFCVYTLLVKINTKIAAYEIGAEEVVHYDWVPTTDFPSSLYSPWMENMFICWQTQWILSSWIKHKWPAYYQTMWLVRRLTIKFVYTYKYCFINCHSFRSTMLLLQDTHVHELPPIVSYACTCVFLTFMQHDDRIKELRSRSCFLHTTLFQYYSYSIFTRVKRTHLIGMKLPKKKIELSVKCKSP